MQMLYCFVNNIHVDYAELLWEGLYYSLHHPTSSIPYPRFTKIIVSHYMTIFPDISRRARDMYHNLQDDDIMKNIFNSGRHKNKVGMQIPAWMITDEMKLTEHYRMYAEVFGIDVPLTQSQPTESTQGTHRTPSAPRRSTRLTPPAPVPTVDKADEMILQDTLQVSLAEHKSREEQEARENVALVDEHLASEEIEKMVDGQENISPSGDAKEKEVEISKEKEVELTNVVIPVNVNDEDEEITDEVYELKRREKGKIVEETRNSPIPTPIRSPRIHTNLLERQKAKEETERLIAKAILQERGNIQAQISTQIENAIANVIPSQVDASVRSYMSGHILHVHPAQSQTSSVPEQQYQLYLAMKADPQLQQQDIAIWLALQMKFERNTIPQTACRTPAVRPRDQDDPHDDAHPEGENSAKRQKTSEYEAYMSGESSSGQMMIEIPSKASIHKKLWKSIAKPDYKNLNKNDIEDIYLLIMNGKVPDYADTGLLYYQQKVNLTAPTITFPGIEDHEMFSIIYEPVHGDIYKNSKKEKLVMRHLEIHKFCDAMLNRVLEGLKSYNNDVKYGYVQKDLTKDETEYLKLFEEEIKERLKHRRKMRRWEMYMNGRPLGSRRERPE
ncbi:hypothetical protein Tco_0058131 [Tanacetum coccineum]